MQLAAQPSAAAAPHAAVGAGRHANSDQGHRRRQCAHGAGLAVGCGHAGSSTTQQQRRLRVRVLVRVLVRAPARAAPPTSTERRRRRRHTAPHAACRLPSCGWACEGRHQARQRAPAGRRQGPAEGAALTPAPAPSDTAGSVRIRSALRPDFMQRRPMRGAVRLTKPGRHITWHGMASSPWCRAAAHQRPPPSAVRHARAACTEQRHLAAPPGTQRTSALSGGRRVPPRASLPTRHASRSSTAAASGRPSLACIT